MILPRLTVKPVNCRICGDVHDKQRVNTFLCQSGSDLLAKTMRNIRSSPSEGHFSNLSQQPSVAGCSRATGQFSYACLDTVTSWDLSWLPSNFITMTKLCCTLSWPAAGCGVTFNILHIYLLNVLLLKTPLLTRLTSISQLTWCLRRCASGAF